MNYVVISIGYDLGTLPSDSVSTITFGTLVNKLIWHQHFYGRFDHRCNQSTILGRFRRTAGSKQKVDRNSFLGLRVCPSSETWSIYERGRTF